MPHKHNPSSQFVKRFSIALLSLSIIFFVSSCHKKSQTSFELNRYEYGAGEQLEITNFKTRNKNQIWEITNELNVSVSKIEGNQPQFILPIMSDDGIYQLNCYDGKKEFGAGIKTSKQFLIKTLRGPVVFHKYNSVIQFSLYVDGQFVLSSNTTSNTVDLPLGKRIIKIDRIDSDGNITESTTELINVSSSDNSQIDVY